ncbi:MAG: hypothetical protein U1E06_18895 [Tabrizicola sp.]|uniref:hypothetical protein n=1 Tax=Tabrizicola sp. TaxID=2005166 RepID=UPI0027327E16|nr:hypothetical protein [Tabrizicola sp.]MDP3263059.1 hypothetical protein [Tabrizicola sp.]MDP3648594.1 hypothetical protein [Paracoccaceae bacterium]MDZ4068874.1 hypothetical protein [Tabrizicola sp.]
MWDRIGLAVGLIAGSAGVAVAQQSEVLFSHKHWQVEIVGWDDGSLGCVAQVSAPGESFSIWTFPDETVQLQFYSTAWSFDEGTTADLEVQIDRRSPWNLTNAELYQNSVLFTLPDDSSGVNFIVEVAQGNRLFLRADDGSDVQDYSLSGSRASIDALIDCGEVLSGEVANPFK